MGRIRYLIGFSVIVLLTIVFWGYTSNTTDLKQDSRVKTSDIIKAFQNEGLKLNFQPSLSIKDLAAEGIIPKVYDIESKDDRIYNEKILIYEFPSIEDRKLVLQEHRDFYYLDDFEAFESLKNEENQLLYYLFDVKNIIVGYVYQYSPEHLLELSKENTLEVVREYQAPNLKAITRIWLDELNNAEHLRFEGESENWLGKADIKQYIYEWKDSEGKTHFETLVHQVVRIKYKGDMGEQEYMDMKVACKRPGGSSSGDYTYGRNLHEDGYSVIDSGSRQGYYTPEISYSLDLEWDDMTESFELLYVE
ncbi:MAG: hypothetical protein APF84_01010 [Gracilibacter sp. BRH_c7a]|nr:MAG: hypothetical protein APF84_01010 [Gracilibacter sp. BRH_c7a]